ncbi:hypothetical protein ACIBL6_15635 [Streptomyces sp. NPDC050400]|uniref:hypothetical protein n=1 Tax=Streptomyces sp. NPDC050400 TaxID=3365610 RepID=UPI0037B5C486
MDSVLKTCIVLIGQTSILARIPAPASSCNKKQGALELTMAVYIASARSAGAMFAVSSTVTISNPSERDGRSLLVSL